MPKKVPEMTLSDKTAFLNAMLVKEGYRAELVTTKSGEFQSWKIRSDNWFVRQFLPDLGAINFENMCAITVPEENTSSEVIVRLKNAIKLNIYPRVKIVPEANMK